METRTQDIMNVVLFLCFALKESFVDFQALEDRITLVATKVVHLGDQLETANNRRNSLEEARDVLKYLDEFKTKGMPSADVFMQVNRVRVRERQGEGEGGGESEGEAGRG